MTSQKPAPPREPEIEFLARVVRGFLVGMRRALWLGGVVALGWAAWRLAAPPPGDGPYAGTHPIAPHFVWLCIGLPLVVRHTWLFGRGRCPMLGVLAVLWVAPQWLPGHHEWDVVVRAFASFVACSSLLVWRTLFALTTADR